MLDSMFEGDYRGKKAHPPDVDAVLARAADAGVERLIVTAGNLEESRRALEFVRARRAAGSRVALFSTVGVHPTRALEFLPAGERAEVEAAMQRVADAGDDAAAAAAASAELAALEAAVLARDSVAPAVAAHCAALEAVLREGRAEGLVVAVGECGLDYDRLFFCPAAVQRRGFEAQLGLARRAGLPLFLHNRNTGDDFARLCAERRESLAAGGVVHSFDGDAAELGALLGLGLHIGLNGCSLKTPANLAVAAAVPPPQLHLETDAPWCGVKRTHAGHASVRPDASLPAEVKKERWVPGAVVKDRCEPCHIPHVLQALCGARLAARGGGGGGGAAGAPADEQLAEEARVADAAYSNSLRLFWPGESPE